MIISFIVLLPNKWGFNGNVAIVVMVVVEQQTVSNSSPSWTTTTLPSPSSSPMISFTDRFSLERAKSLPTVESRISYTWKQKVPTTNEKISKQKIKGKYNYKWNKQGEQLKFLEFDILTPSMILQTHYSIFCFQDAINEPKFHGLQYKEQHQNWFSSFMCCSKTKTQR